MEADYIWDGYRQRRIVLQGCAECGSVRFLPAHRCPTCGSAAWRPVTASGNGSVYSYIITRRPVLPVVDRFPVIVLVELEEGPRLVSNLCGVNPTDVRIGMPVVACFDDEEETALVRFRPRTTAGAM
jgi:uncharacterized OB-fold protein